MPSVGDIIRYLESNPILPTVASGGIAVWLISNIRNIFGTAVGWITNLISFVVYNNYTDERGFGHGMYEKQIAFDSIVSESRTIWERTTNLDLSSDLPFEAEVEDCDESRGEETNSGSPKMKAYGFSIRILLGKLVVVTRTINKNQKITVDTSIRVFFAKKRKFLEKLSTAITNRALKNREDDSEKDIVKIHYGSEIYNCYVRKNKRSMDSIFLDGNGHRELLEDIRKFLSNRSLYQTMNYPYKYSALIYGVPGSGKTSTILAIASELKREIDYVNISRVSATDLMNRLNRFPKRIFVFEDIDAVGFSANSCRPDGESPDRESGGSDDGCDDVDPFKGGSSGMNLSDILNITDGLLSSDGVVCIFTTNHKERLDPAFLRAGRMNKTIEFGYMNGETASRMVRYHLGEDVGNMKDGIKPAELQECILDVKVGRKTLEDLKMEFCDEKNS